MSHPSHPRLSELSSLRRLGLVYFLYLFLFSGLEFTLSFLAHERFQFSRWVCRLWDRARKAPELLAPPLIARPPSLQQGKMFFFIGLTMAAVQGAYTRGICPGRELAAISQVRGGNA